MAALGELYDNCHLLCQPAGRLPSLEAVCEHLLGHFEWLEESVHTHAAAFKLAQLPALQATEVFQRQAAPEPEAEPVESAPVEQLKRLHAVLPMDRRRHDVFITHAQASGQDQCKTLCMLLTAAGFTVWYDMQATDLTAEGMEAGVSQSRTVLIL
eukprot:SAG11_NODE_3727_length_2260_cov_2.555298_2_plen_155_part_00